MDNVKEAFRYVREDINFLNSEISEIKNQLRDICSILENLSKNKYNSSIPNTHVSNQINQTDKFEKSDISTDNYDFKPLNDQNMPISIGNQGVSTDRQQTDNKQTTNRRMENSIDKAVEILDSLDSLKKEIRIKFKRLTEQEILIFSALYQLDESQGYADYKTLSTKLNLTESSIRDYVRRLINKDIPIEKRKLNNKSIQLTISNNLKKVATLPTILQLREI